MSHTTPIKTLCILALCLTIGSGTASADSHAEAPAPGEPTEPATPETPEPAEPETPQAGTPEKPETPVPTKKKALPKRRPDKPLDPSVIGPITSVEKVERRPQRDRATNPWLLSMGETTLGGYADIHFRYEAVEGLTDELTFVPEMFNFFTFTPVGDRVRVASELEIEEAEEFKLELGMVDIEIDPAFTFRAGILLVPIGRFNVEHDSPQNEFTDRPLAVTEIIPSTLSEVGMGFHGAFHPTAGSYVNYEIYAVNGLTEVVAQDAQTRISAGKDNFTDNNPSPSVAGRLGLSPVAGLELGLSGHYGPYNAYDLEGERVEKKRNLGLYAVDLRIDRGRFHLQSEFAWALLDVPAEAGGLYASSQWGMYTQFVVRFLQDSVWAGSSFAGGLRYGFVDFNADGDGDHSHRFTAGLNFRPIEETVVKLDYQRTISEDPLANVEHSAAILFSVASYF